MPSTQPENPVDSQEQSTQPPVQPPVQPGQPSQPNQQNHKPKQILDTAYIKTIEDLIRSPLWEKLNIKHEVRDNMCCFTRNGTLIAMDHRELMIFGTSRVVKMFSVLE